VSLPICPRLPPTSSNELVGRTSKRSGVKPESEVRDSLPAWAGEPTHTRATATHAANCLNIELFAFLRRPKPDKNGISRISFDPPAPGRALTPSPLMCRKIVDQPRDIFPNNLHAAVGFSGRSGTLRTPVAADLTARSGHAEGDQALRACGFSSTSNCGFISSKIGKAAAPSAEVSRPAAPSRMRGVVRLRRAPTEGGNGSSRS